ncbi:MAG: type II toxin-antitoxin system PemK/MazF family toxin [gamma proteobacterium symbiont of Bathyaustriella thionipta]|nr:type II toxin-antitoxin system PemK/MazF family toxin [gamma proteobacterium symbiont of Bathyaustriella thionipta]MCU7949446.1 type II toxin-antitoxin system PemK/MazF family toxin [gamma proteobacterium symbiont of Bathyaustriella thionipta]MCU7954047.1 type II toxin-antitoxin system PemK/MazF family toxin [gamma proteobacterium symbiont of Bathyaustriella thionipta]MCU7956033.1 type II toxin-antitoxin system PemK/MazF family toxin [gamma proteobacterium symbiont of Bathyaustriella thionipt
MKKGDIWWASLDEPIGSEPGYRRPVIIISSNDFNRSQIRTVIVAIITSNLCLADAPGNFKLSKKSTATDRDSVVNISQLMTLDKSFLTEHIGKLSRKQLNFLDESLKLVLKL